MALDVNIYSTNDTEFTKMKKKTQKVYLFLAHKFDVSYSLNKTLF